MGPFFTIVVVIYLMAVFVRLSNEINKTRYVANILQYFRLRRRRFSHPSSFVFKLKLAKSKLMCRLGRHLHSEQMKYLQRLEPNTVLTCERWFCKEFSGVSHN